jgi:hypothetical protein
MTKIIACYSRKRAAWVRYERPSRHEALLNARATEATVFDPVERGSVTGCVPMVWRQADGAFVSKSEAEAV